MRVSACKCVWRPTLRTKWNNLSFCIFVPRHESTQSISIHIPRVFVQILIHWTVFFFSNEMLSVPFGSVRSISPIVIHKLVMCIWFPLCFAFSGFFSAKSACFAYFVQRIDILGANISFCTINKYTKWNQWMRLVTSINPKQQKSHIRMDIMKKCSTICWCSTEMLSNICYAISANDHTNKRMLIILEFYFRRNTHTFIGWAFTAFEFYT